MPLTATESPARETPDVLTAAERIRAAVPLLRQCGVDDLTCEQIDQLASMILSAAWLGDPADRRVERLGAALHLLAQRIVEILRAADRSRERSAPERRDPLAPLRAMSESERIALFS